MEKAKIINKGSKQYVKLPKKLQLNSKKVIFIEHELGLLIVDPKKRLKVLEKIMGSMVDFFPDGREQI